MKALQEFIAQKNHWNSFFKGEQYEIQTAAGRQRVADMIDAALSPENLTCDGDTMAMQFDAVRFASPAVWPSAYTIIGGSGMSSNAAG